MHSENISELISCAFKIQSDATILDSATQFLNMFDILVTDGVVKFDKFKDAIEEQPENMFDIFTADDV